MKDATRKRPRIGDIIEIATPRGFAYAQYTHRHDEPPRYGELIRVLPGLFEIRPTTFSDLAKHRERFLAFFPLGVACRRGIVTIVANESVPDWAQGFPVFRSEAYPVIRPQSYSGPFTWWLWDGQTSWQVSELSSEQRNFPLLAIWNDTMLIDRIINNWSPADVE